MNSARSSIKLFGIYMIVIPGVGLMFFPEFILTLFSLRFGEELWLPRMLGLLAFIIGVNYMFIAKYRLIKLYNLTIVMRYFSTLFMLMLWVFDQVEAMILLFATIDAMGATWTLLTRK